MTEDTQFEITSNITLKAVQRFVEQAGKRNKSFWIQICVFSVLCIVFASWQIVAGSVIYGLFFLCLSLIIPLRYLFSKERSIKKCFDTFKRLYPQMQIDYWFSEESFGSKEGKTFTYQQLSEISETKEYFYLYFGQSCLFLEKDGFTKGDPASFFSFVLDKVEAIPSTDAQDQEG